MPLMTWARRSARRKVQLGALAALLAVSLLPGVTGAMQAQAAGSGPVYLDPPPPTPPDPVQAKMMWIMPLVFSVMFFFFPAGLVLYWLTNNILSIAQQYLINKRLGVIGK